MDDRVATAFDLVQRQRRLVDTTRVGSLAHRQASDVLALIEESHFLLSELGRQSAVASKKMQPMRARSRPGARERRVSVQLVLAFAAAIVAGAVVLELADPAPMKLQASELQLEPAQP